MFSLSLRQKFILCVSFILAVWLGTASYIENHVSRRQLVESRELEAVRSAELIEWAVHQDMLADRRPDIQKFLEKVRAQREIENVRIFDIKGLIRLSAIETDVGRHVDEPACLSCHPNGTDKPAKLGALKNRRTFRTADGQSVLSITRPILNEPACYTAECHIHTPDEKTLGILDVHVSLDEVDAEVAANTRRIIAHAALTAILVGLTLALLFQYLISRPLNRLRGAMAAVKDGDLDARADADRRDELGDVAESFNSMAVALKEAHDTLEQQVVHADKLASVGEMMAGLAHEIRSPLAGISTAAQVLYEGMDPADNRREILDQILQQIARLHETVTNLLQFARPRTPRPRSANINDIVERIFFLINAQIRTQGIEVKKDYALNPPPVQVDPEQMQQAFLGLALNAIQAMPSGGVLRVATDVEKPTGTNNGCVHVTIEDTGQGIPEEHIKSIFGPFFTTKPTGTGLGLSIVKRIVQSHHSSIDVESRVGEGTRFTVSIPIGPETDTTDTEDDD